MGQAKPELSSKKTELPLGPTVSNWDTRIRPAGEAPWLDYEDITQDEVLVRLGDLSEANRSRVLEYEKSREKPRKGIIETLGGTVVETSNEADDHKSSKKYDWVTPTE